MVKEMNLAIEQLTEAFGKCPKRIEMPDGKLIVLYRGVEFLVNSSMAQVIANGLRFKIIEGDCDDEV